MPSIGLLIDILIFSLSFFTCDFRFVEHTDFVYRYVDFEWLNWCKTHNFQHQCRMSEYTHYYIFIMGFEYLDEFVYFSVDFIEMQCATLEFRFIVLTFRPWHFIRCSDFAHITASIFKYILQWMKMRAKGIRKILLLRKD